MSELVVSRWDYVDIIEAMRQHLAGILYASALGGCSLIYNPSNLPDKGAKQDAAIADANPSLLHLDEVKSGPLQEGAGKDGSSPQILVVYGGHMTQMLTVEVVSSNPAATITVGEKSIAEDGNSFAVLVTAEYSMLNEAAGPIPLMIKANQPGATEKVIAWSLKTYDELTGTGAQPPMAKTFSKIEVPGSINFNPVGGPRLIMKVIGGVSVTDTMSANGGTMTNQMPGPGGCAGGAVGQDPTGCFGNGKGGLTGGGGGGYGTAGAPASGTGGPVSGDPLIKEYDAAGAALNKAGGGAGGSGGAGGGGGGSLEITAGGNISIGMVQAIGASGGSGGTLGAGGGGGAGGLVLLRAGGTLKFPMVNVSGGPGGGGLGMGGAGGIGRWRYDAAATMGTEPTAPAGGHGPMLVHPPNPIFETNKANLTVAGTSGTMVKVILNPDGLAREQDVSLNNATRMFEVDDLEIGLNTVCVYVPGARTDKDEARNCIEIAFIP